MSEHAEWCRTQFALMSEGGMWIVPRSGLVFQKNDGQLVLVNRMPGFTIEFQLDDYETIRDEFEQAGIKVVKSDEMS